MFAKKLLSFIGVLFVGSQLISTVSADLVSGLPDCKVAFASTTSQNSFISYCISEENVIKKVSTTDEPTNGFYDVIKAELSTGIYGFSIDSASSASITSTTMVFQNGGFIDGSNPATDYNKYSLYDCTFDVANGIDCIRTYGYLNIDGDNYVEIGITGNKIHAKDGSDEKTICSEEGSIYKDGEDEIFKLCIGESLGVQFVSDSAEPKSYFVKNTAGNIFNDAPDDENSNAPTGINKKSIIVKASKNAFTLVDRDYDYCESQVTKEELEGDPKKGEEAIETFKNICNDATSDDDEPCGKGKQIYISYQHLVNRDKSCMIKIEQDDETGTSTVTGTLNCKEEGYYLFNSQVESDGYNHLQYKKKEGDLYYCEPDTKSQSGEFKCAKYNGDDYKQGYYINAAANYGLSLNAYIKCGSTYDKCIVDDVKVPNGESNCENAGDIILEDKVYKLCLDKGENVQPVPIDKDATEIKQFVSIANANVFYSGTTKSGRYVSVVSNNGNVLVDVAEASIPADESETPKPIYKKYIYTTDLYVQKSKGDEGFSDSVCAANSVIVEFKIDDFVTNGQFSPLIYEKQATYKNSSE